MADSHSTLRSAGALCLLVALVIYKHSAPLELKQIVDCAFGANHPLTQVVLTTIQPSQQ